MIKENVKIVGNLSLLLTDEFGNRKLDKNYPNLVVQVGKEYIAQRMTSNTATIMSHIAIGSGTTTPANTDTFLQSEITRVAFSSVTVTSNTISYSCTFGSGVGTGGITEAGIFNSGTANSGIMLSRTTFPVINKEFNDTFSITWNVSPN